MESIIHKPLRHIFIGHTSRLLDGIQINDELMATAISLLYVHHLIIRSQSVHKIVSIKDRKSCSPPDTLFSQQSNISIRNG